MALPSNRNEQCVGPTASNAGKASTCDGCPNQSSCSTGKFNSDQATANQKKEKAQISARLENVSNIILVLSGKGGVGKSTVSTQLAWSLSHYGYSVGVLDIDICGPSVAKMMGVENQEVHKSNFGWTPVYAKDNLCVMSVAFLLQSSTDAIIWRGPRKNGLIKQFLIDVEWEDLDFLIIDAPPGTSDEHISIAQLLSGVNGGDDDDDTHTNVKSVIVTTPQEVALLDVRKEISFCKKVNLDILGVIQNMDGFVCPECSHCSKIFSGNTGGAQKLCKENGLKFLGSLPIDPELLKCSENGKGFLEHLNAKKHGKNGKKNKGKSSGSNETKKALVSIVQKIVKDMDEQLVQKMEECMIENDKLFDNESNDSIDDYDKDGSGETYEVKTEYNENDGGDDTSDEDEVVINKNINSVDEEFVMNVD